MYMFVTGIKFGSFYDILIGFWNCSNNVVFFTCHFIAYERNWWSLLQKHVMWF